MKRAINPLVAATASPAILESRAWLPTYDGRMGPAIDLSQAAPPYAPPPELLERLARSGGIGGHGALWSGARRARIAARLCGPRVPALRRAT